MNLISSRTHLATRAEELAALCPGWLDGHGEQIDRGDLGLALRTAHLLVERELCEPALFPQESGGVSLEWRWGEGSQAVSVDLTIEQGCIETLVTDHSLEREHPRKAVWHEHTADTLDALLDILEEQFREAG